MYKFWLLNGMWIMKKTKNAINLLHRKDQSFQIPQKNTDLSPVTLEAKRNIGPIFAKRCEQYKKCG